MSHYAITDARGFTIVEVVVASFVLAISALAILGIADAGTRNNFRAEQSQVVSTKLQAELEAIQALDYDDVAMMATPAEGIGSNNPLSRVSANTFALSRDGTDYGEMVVSAAGGVQPGPTPFTNGDVSGNIHRFVTWRDDPNCSVTQCPDAAHGFKTVVVVATINDAGASFARTYQEIHSDISDPNAISNDPSSPSGGGGGGVCTENCGSGDPEGPCTTNCGGTSNPQITQFWLTDTTCNNTSRSAPSVDHATHNTRGVCSDGTQTGNTLGAPDLMYTQAPALDSAFDPDAQPQFSYSTDVSSRDGLVMQPGSSDGCTLSYLSGGALDFPLLSSEPNKQRKLHKWVSPSIGGNVNLLATGTATLEMFTRTADGASSPGRICVWLFRRQFNALGLPIDLPIVSVPLATQYSDSSWPTDWTEISVPMSFASVSLVPGDRIGLAITVERDGSSGNSLEFMYDHPTYESRLEVQTDAVITYDIN